MQGARYTTVRCHAVDLTCVPPDVGMYALARHWVRGTGLQPPLDIETDTLSEQGAQVRATLRHVQLLAFDTTAGAGDSGCAGGEAAAAAAHMQQEAGSG